MTQLPPSLYHKTKYFGKYRLCYWDPERKNVENIVWLFLHREPMKIRKMFDAARTFQCGSTTLYWTDLVQHWYSNFTLYSNKFLFICQQSKTRRGLFDSLNDTANRFTNTQVYVFKHPTGEIISLLYRLFLWCLLKPN